MNLKFPVNMNFLDTLYKNVFNYFYEQKEKRREKVTQILNEFDPENVTCTIDDEPVNCNTWQKDGFLDDLYIKGFDFNSDKNWYERTWTTNTREGTESTIEVYQQDKSTGNWKSLMFGNTGELFYEEDVK